jgi:mannosyltransferase
VRGTGVISAGTVRPGADHPVASSRRLLDWLALVVPAAAALVVGGYHLGQLSLWRDEAYSLEAANRSIPQIFALLHHTDAVNGTYYLFMHGVIGLLGTSATALRVPSLIATAVAAAMTAALGRLLARRAGLPAPWLAGLLAGLLYVATPQVTRYAQDARAYAIVTMFVTIATYLLVRAMMAGTWRWWAGYALAIVAGGVFNLFSLLVVVAHAVTVLLTYVARRRAAQAPDSVAGDSRPAESVAGHSRTADSGAADSGAAGSGTAVGPVPVRLRRWLVAAVVAGIALSPLVFLGNKQRGQISWLTKPGVATIRALLDGFAGSRTLVYPIAVLALCGLAAGSTAKSRRAAVPGSLTPAAVAGPWLVLPPVIMIAISRFKPIYDIRYVLFCQPALALLCGVGLVWLARVISQAPFIAQAGARARSLAWLPSAGLVVLVLVLLIAPQRAVRQPSSRPDNLRYNAAVIAAHARPTDIVFYIPWNQRVLGMGYPGPFSQLRDIALAESPVKSDTLLGTEVSLATLHHRLHNVSRVWLITSVSKHTLATERDPVERAELTLIHGMRLIGRWHADDDWLSLYAVR